MFNNNPNEKLTTRDVMSEKAIIINATADLGLVTRFAVVPLLENECVMVIDDDLVPCDGAVEQLYAHWCFDPDVLHGKFGRKPKTDGTYAKDVVGNEECPIVLTRIMMMSQAIIPTFFKLLRSFKKAMDSAKPKGNGEDILMSYAAMKFSGRLNIIHDIQMKELPAPHAIHARAGHIKHRTALMQGLEKWLHH